MIRLYVLALESQGALPGRLNYLAPLIPNTVLWTNVCDDHAAGTYNGSNGGRA